MASNRQSVIVCALYGRATTRAGRRPGPARPTRFFRLFGHTRTRPGFSGVPFRHTRARPCFRVCRLGTPEPGPPDRGVPFGHTRTRPGYVPGFQLARLLSCLGYTGLRKSHAKVLFFFKFFFVFFEFLLLRRVRSKRRVGNQIPSCACSFCISLALVGVLCVSDGFHMAHST